MTTVPNDKTARLANIIDLTWDIFFQRICTGRTAVNKEASMQLHLSTILHGLGELFCVQPGEIFDIELESKYEKSNIDIVCGIGDIKAAIELKCFKKSSNRATDLDMYDVFKDVYRLQSFNGFQVKKFICLTDNPYYVNGEHTGHASSVTIKDGMTYRAGDKVQPSWVGKWKDNSRDTELKLEKDVVFNWVQYGPWYYIKLDI